MNKPKSLFELAHSTVLINNKNDITLPNHFQERLGLRWPGLGNIENFKTTYLDFHIFIAGGYMTAEEAYEKAERDGMIFLAKFFHTLCN